MLFELTARFYQIVKQVHMCWQLPEHTITLPGDSSHVTYSKWQSDVICRVTKLMDIQTMLQEASRENSFRCKKINLNSQHLIWGSCQYFFVSALNVWRRLTRDSTGPILHSSYCIFQELLNIKNIVFSDILYLNYKKLHWIYLAIIYL